MGCSLAQRNQRHDRELDKVKKGGSAKEVAKH